MKSILQDFESHKGIYKYAKIGITLSVVKIPFKQKNRMFCSEFVAEVLKRSEATAVKKNSALYFPEDLSKLPKAVLAFQGNLQEYINHYALAPALAA